MGLAVSIKFSAFASRADGGRVGGCRSGVAISTPRLSGYDGLPRAIWRSVPAHVGAGPNGSTNASSHPCSRKILPCYDHLGGLNALSTVIAGSTGELLSPVVWPRTGLRIPARVCPTRGSAATASPLPRSPGRTLCSQSGPRELRHARRAEALPADAARSATILSGEPPITRLDQLQKVSGIHRSSRVIFPTLSERFDDCKLSVETSALVEQTPA
jgi:hypothetical protein